MQNVTYITARDGRVQFFAGDVHVGEGSTALELTAVIKCQSLDLEGAYFSSTMDFADEEGFENHDDAKKLLTSAISMV